MMKHTLTLAILLLALSAPLAAQDDPLAQVRRLRDEGELAAARTLVESHLETFPQDGNALWLLGQLAWWQGDARRARQAYETALALLPDEPWLRVDAGRFFAEAGRHATTFRLLTPLAEDARAPADVRAEAAFWLASAAYWQGDLADAVRRTEALLAAAPEHVRARELRASLAVELRPWLRGSFDARHDSQGLDGRRVGAEAGGFVTGNLALAGTGALERLAAQREAQTVWRAGVETRAYLPALRAQLRLAGGGVRSDRSGESAATAGAEVRLRSWRAADLRFTFARQRYDATLASLDTLFNTSTYELALDAAERPGLAGVVAYRREHFPDGNVVSAQYAWLLVPLATGLRAGYSVSGSDADSSRWQTVRYAPYYTPEDLLVHSALLELRLPHRALDLRVTGGYALHAREQAPVRDPLGGLAFFERKPSLWHARASFTAPLHQRVQLHAEAERRVATYYRATRGALSLAWRPGR